MTGATDDILYRASFDLHAEGRTLVGIAVPWNKSSRVQDPWSPRPYLEAFDPDSFTRTLEQHRGQPFPLFDNHGWKRGEDPIGVATFQRSASGLLYEAPLSMTRSADEQLTLVRDGAKRSVSVGFRGIKQRAVRWAEGDVTLRTEVALRELSLAATGFGAHPDARVLAVRDEEGEEYDEERFDAWRAAHPAVREQVSTEKRDALTAMLKRMVLPPPSY